MFCRAKRHSSRLPTKRYHLSVPENRTLFGETIGSTYILYAGKALGQKVTKRKMSLPFHSDVEFYSLLPTKYKCITHPDLHSGQGYTQRSFGNC